MKADERTTARDSGGGFSLDSLRHDAVAGITLAAYAIPVSLAYATLAGLPPVVGIYGYLLGGLGYALVGSSRHLAVGPTSAISLMVGGAVGGMAGDDALRYVQIASLAGFTVGALCLIAWLLRLSVLVKLISDSVLVGFKAGAGLTIAATQLPALLGTAGGGHNFPERIALLAGQLPQANLWTLALGAAALGLLWLGERRLPGRPVALAVVAISIVAAGALGLASLGIALTGPIPTGLPTLQLPAIRLRDQEGIVPLAAGCMLLAYIEGVAAARGFARKHGYALDPRRELLGLAAANVAAAAGGGYPVAGGLSQSAVNEQAGARSRASLVFASVALAAALLFLGGLIADLPKATLAAIVLMAVRGLVDFPALVHMWRVSRIDFVGAAAALVGVLLLGILQGILLAALVSVLALLTQASRPHVAILGRIPGTRIHSDATRHPENERVPGVLALRPEASLLYLNADHVRDVALEALAATVGADARLVVVDLSASPFMDLSGARMLADLHVTLAARGISLAICGAHGRGRDLLRAEGVAQDVAGIERGTTVEDAIAAFGAGTVDNGRAHPRG